MRIRILIGALVFLGVTVHGYAQSPVSVCNDSSELINYIGVNSGALCQNHVLLNYGDPVLAPGKCVSYTPGTNFCDPNTVDIGTLTGKEAIWRGSVNDGITLFTLNRNMSVCAYSYSSCSGDDFPATCTTVGPAYSEVPLAGANPDVDCQ